ncbi:sodium:proton antiporter [Lactococcus hodotermopsidis]|uniref:Sodium:proton antiporter n=1 Tax=Pseudolactococcus hodotermopsidis TaxID=2709157 RepID=A0A6A0BAI9_9LACT|nr:cation:proton antiporter [Lactococcus hodotermopsidis]GFH41816.1 sodium:proton antiporter [Lactococcus hodotermopsidis]
MQELFQITLILGASLMATVVSRRIGMPAVVGQLLLGILLAPSVLGLIHGTETLEFLAEIGVILLMFLAGLESDFDLLKKYMKPSLLVAILGVIVPLIAYAGLTAYMGYKPPIALFYGIVFAATSVSITVEVLQEYGKLTTQAGAVILGAAVADDIIAVLVLSFFMSSQKSDGNLALKFALQVIFLVFLYLAFKWLVPFVFHLINKLTIFAKYITASLLICFIFSLLADFVGMSAVIGAFFAGLAIGQTTMAEKIETSISTIAYTFFIPIFFMTIALPIQFNGILASPLFVICLTILAILTKLVPSYLISRSFKFAKRDSLLIGSGMVSRGEMALIVTQIGLASKLIDTTIYSELVIVIILSTLIAPFLIKASLTMT